MAPFTIALFGNSYQQKKSTRIQMIIDSIHRHGMRLAIEKEYGEFLKSVLNFSMEGATIFEKENFQADLALSIGGDGTFLKAASYVRSKHIPIMGVNMGRLGFLADVNAENLDTTLEHLLEGHYRIEERAVLEVETEGRQLSLYPFALNEIAVLKHDISSMISIHTAINGDYLVTYQCDGLIVSTPTGSTAYSLSVGGPIMTPGSGNLVLSPVAPHSLNIRPIVMKDNVEITLDVESRSHDFLVAVDGRSESCHEHTKLTIRKAPYTIRVIQREKKEFFQTLREKMMWGADPRVNLQTETNA